MLRDPQPDPDVPAPGPAETELSVQDEAGPVLTTQARQRLWAALAMGIALCLMALTAWWAVLAIEARTTAAIRSRLMTDGMTWASVSANGLAVHLDGTAPDEAARFRAVNLAGGIVDANRIRDGLAVAALRAVKPPEFSVEILRNSDGLSLIGLMPSRGADAAQLPDAQLAADVGAIVPGLPVADMLETADYPAPEGWQGALDFGVAALRLLPRSKISIAADRVAITAISDSAAQKRRFEAELARLAPAGLRTAIDISAPRPVLTPFTLRFVADARGPRFDACAADSDRARDRIVASAVSAGADKATLCTVGLGVPTPRWADATVAGIAAVSAMGEGTVTFSDADVTLLAGASVDQDSFDRAVGELRAALPPVFSLTATLPPKAAGDAPQGPAEFNATLSAGGRVELRGRVTDDLLRGAVGSFARAAFAGGTVYNATRTDADLPDGWPVRVLAGIEALGALTEGRVSVRADKVEISGIAGSTTASEHIAQVLSSKLGPGQDFTVAVTYDKRRDPEAGLPSAAECVAGLNAVLATRKIVFAAGSVEIDREAAATLDALAEVLRPCPPLTVEISGHTDSQGSERGNQALSQARAEAVMVGLSGRRIDVSGYVAKGYGEARPIADNATETGREANRRIEFALDGSEALTAPVAGPATGANVPQADRAAQDDSSAVAADVSVPTAAVVPAGAAPAATLSAAGVPVALADGAAMPDLGTARSDTLNLAPDAVFAPSDETTRRPERRPEQPSAP